MLNKLYVQTKNFIKENIKYILILIIAFFVFNFKLPYYIDIPGGLIDVSERLEVEDGYSINGSLNLAYVSEFRATIPILIIAYFNDDWEIIKKEDIVADNETIEENNYRNKILLEEANQNAIIVAFDKAGLDYKVENRKVNIIYVYEEADTDLKIGDTITEINGIKINSKEDISAITKEADELSIKIINNGVEYTRYANKINIGDGEFIGITVSETKDVITSKDVAINFKESESGPSGGFMMSLSIYDCLTADDLTKGLKIVGTGTIDEFGNVGAIGGIAHKIKAAVKEEADIFFAPSANYEEALKVVTEEELDITLVEVSNIDDAIEYLNNL